MYVQNFYPALKQPDSLTLNPEGKPVGCCTFKRVSASAGQSNKAVFLSCSGELGQLIGALGCLSPHLRGGRQISPAHTVVKCALRASPFSDLPFIEPSKARWTQEMDAIFKKPVHDICPKSQTCKKNFFTSYWFNSMTPTNMKHFQCCKECLSSRGKQIRNSINLIHFEIKDIASQEMFQRRRNSGKNIMGEIQDFCIPFMSIVLLLCAIKSKS